MTIWYSVTILASAFLLFLVQPMVGKMVLPLYGGTSAVWNGCQLFFQGMLLLGYAYAHFSVKWFGPRRQVVVHIALMLLPLAVLPPLIGNRTALVAGVDPVTGLLGVLLLTIGAPFFVLASHSPLLQRWFAAAGQPAGGDPYFLYAASNAGSLIGLLAYPTLAEPLLTLAQQSRIWSLGYLLLIPMLAVAALPLLRSRGAHADAPGLVAGDQVEPPRDPITTRQRLFWAFAAFIPSSLMLSVTQYASTNIAAVPLLWVVPLTLYLLTFVHAFARRPLVSQRALVRVVPFVAIPFAPLLFFSIRGSGLLLVSLHLVAFFVIALVCHGELARRRPAPRDLTEFYLLVSVGGVAGGLFNTALAPVLFQRIGEYPLAVFLACLVLPGLSSAADSPRQRRYDVLAPLLVAGLAAAVLVLGQLLDRGPDHILFSLLFAPAALICFSCKQRPLRFALTYGVLLAALAGFAHLQLGDQLLVARNFYGVKQVILDRTGDVRSLKHGTVIHGSQYVQPERRAVPLTYYHRQGPLGDVFALDQSHGLDPSVAVIGLGVGAIASYATTGQHFVFYEIDPQVVQIARDSGLFTFLADCRGSTEIVLGDGRLALAQAPEHGYGVIVVDAFNSDAIPVHLLTQQALAGYTQKLRVGGYLVFHISNDFFDLETVLGNLARARGLRCLIKHDTLAQQQQREDERFASDYVVIGALDRPAEQALVTAGWQQARTDDRTAIWSDDHTSILGLVKW